MQVEKASRMENRRQRIAAISLWMLCSVTFCGACRRESPPVVATPISEESPTAASDHTRFQGSWKTLAISLDGNGFEPDVVEQFTYEFDGKNYSNLRNGKPQSEGTYKLSRTKPYASIDLDENSKVSMYGLYRFDGDRLTLCLSEDRRPSDFESKSGQRRMLVELEREKP